MAPTFLKQLRRRSRASFRSTTDNSSTDNSSDGATSHGTEMSSGSLTPPSLAPKSDPALNLQFKDSSASLPQQLQAHQRPSILPMSSNSNRYSMSAMSTVGSPSSHSIARPIVPISPYAPRVTNVMDNAWVYQKVLLLNGTIGEAQGALEGSVTVTRVDDQFPAVSWPVTQNHFKALAYLLPGKNRLRLDFVSASKQATSGSSTPNYTSFLTVHNLPLTQTPPLHLAILLAKDSPGTFDTTPSRAEREGNGLEAAVRKFRMAAYLWQAFTAEQMARKKLGRRAFRLEDDWTTGSANMRDREDGVMRSEAKIHIIRVDKTMAELRDLNLAQQNPKAKAPDGLFAIAADAVRSHFNPLPGQELYVSAMMLDTQWDKEAKIIRGHAAKGGKEGDLRLAIFGSHCLHSYPGCFEEVAPAFSDCTKTDTDHVANDCNEAGSSWEAANMGIGAHLHEIGHLFGAPSQESGIMKKDYVVFNRSFVSREAFSTRTKSRGGLALAADECEWHRLACLRFRAHPAFRLLNDPRHTDESISAFPDDQGNAVLVAPSGVSFVEIFAEGDEVCHSWIEYSQDATVQRQVSLTDSDIRARIPGRKRKGPVRIVAYSNAGRSVELADFNKFRGKESQVKIAGGGAGLRSAMLGKRASEGSCTDEVIFSSAAEAVRIMSKIKVYHDEATVNGLEFLYDDATSQLFGKDAGTASSYDLDVRRGEYISGFYVNSGDGINGLRIMTSLGRSSPMYGDAFKGDGCSLIPPRGYRICGLSGSSTRQLDEIAVLIHR